MARESPKAIAAFHEYCLLGPARSLAKLANVSERFGMTTVTVRHLEQWSSAHQWVERASAYDAHLQKEREDLAAVERARVLTTGFAQQHKRIEALNALAKKLLAQAANDERLWLPDVKSVGTGPNAKRVDLVQFNEGLIREIRGCFDDLAKEMGERVKKQELSVKDLPKIYVNLDSSEDGIDP